MELYPAVDIRRGTVSRSRNRPKPIEVAKEFVARGATWIHVVDMDAVFGTGDNLALVREVCGLSDVRVQVGGNLEDPERVQAVVGAGADRVVLGTGVALDAKALSELRASAGEAGVAVALETCEGRVFLRPTGKTIERSPEEFVDTLLAERIDILVYRDVERDGTLAGVNLREVSPVVGRGLSVIYAGGVESLQEIRDAGESGMAGVIVGRALHEGRFGLEDALACLE
jgi:phosphoribosylformimino-5-aminoimidazole carboxamide ribotide isomerase